MGMKRVVDMKEISKGYSSVKRMVGMGMWKAHNKCP